MRRTSIVTEGNKIDGIPGRTGNLETLKIAYLFNKGRLARLQNVADGSVPYDFFYGGIELKNSGHEIVFFEIEINYPPGFFAGLVNISASYGLMPEKLTGGALVQTKKILSALNNFDIVIGTTSGIGYALAFWRSLGKLKVPLVTIHCGLLNHPYGTLRRKLSEYLLSQMKTVLFGEAELQPMIELFNGQKGRIEINQFGVDHRFWVPSAGDGQRYILSVGNDGRRDFETLINAAPKIPCEIKILTSRKLPDELPDNITLVRSSWHKQIVSDEDLRTLYQNARCVVVSLQESFQPSGQSVALQAMACGCPVILTRTKGLWAKGLLSDNKNIIFTSPSNVEELAEKISILLNDDELRKRLRANGRFLIEGVTNSDNFAANMERICKSVARSAGD